MSQRFVTVIKLDYLGQETWRYQGKVLERGENYLVLEAYYDRQDAHFDGLLLKKGDQFIETFYSDRWYNIFEIYDMSNGQLKGWYCNIGWPAVFDNTLISYRDLALDLLVFPDGRQTILDQDEFEALPLSSNVRRQAIAALSALQKYFEDNKKFKI